MCIRDCAYTTNKETAARIDLAAVDFLPWARSALRAFLFLAA
jgi:hypothetical protein